MDKETKIAMLRNMADAKTEDEEVLSVYLTLAGDKILNRMYPFKESYDDLEVPDKYAMVQLNAACYLYNKRGAEGEIQHIENGIHRNYGASDVPDAMLKDVVPYCQVIR